VVLKPSELAPAAGEWLVRALRDAGAPAGVVEIVHGGPETGRALATHADVDGVLFTGSWSVGRALAQATLDQPGKVLALEMGGKNAMIVLDDANLDLALDGVLWGAFGTTGQRCTATSRLVLQRGVHDEFLSRLVDRVRTLRLGDGRQKGTDVGPLINEAALKKVEKYVDIGVQEGADLLIGGRRALGKGLENGFFFEPTIFARVKHGMRIEQEEIFGPVLSVIRVTSVDEAFAVNNGVKYGLSSSVYTRDVNVAFRAQNELDNGITYVNAPTIGAEAHLPFGGVKQTGNGHREGGWEVYQFYSETKVGYVDFSGQLQRAQIDNY
jgi:aldehyde dehydrogenase (NAD+)